MCWNLQRFSNFVQNLHHDMLHKCWKELPNIRLEWILKAHFNKEQQVPGKVVYPYCYTSKENILIIDELIRSSVKVRSSYNQAECLSCYMWWSSYNKGTLQRHRRISLVQKCGTFAGGPIRFSERAVNDTKWWRLRSFIFFTVPWSLLSSSSVE